MRAAQDAQLDTEAPSLFADIHVAVPGSALLTYAIPPELAAAVCPGSLVTVKVRARTLTGCVARVSTAPPPGLAAAKIRPVYAVLAGGTPLPAELVGLAEWVAEYYLSTPGEVLRAAVPPKVGAARRARRTAAHGGDAPKRALTPVRLNDAQRAAADTIGRAALARSSATHLLFGVTGSGKTEVYLEAARRTLAAGRGVLLLAPEISLTTQLVARVRDALGHEVILLHSALAEGERAAAWEKLWRGEARLAMGARSAVFAPVQDLGLLIVDEEHDGAYKQGEQALRYHARDVAVVRAHRAQAACVLGSATPSLESWANAQRGRYTLLRLPDRVEDRPLATVRVVDMRVLRDEARGQRASTKAARERAWAEQRESERATRKAAWRRADAEKARAALGPLFREGPRDVLIAGAEPLPWEDTAAVAVDDGTAVVDGTAVDDGTAPRPADAQKAAALADILLSPELRDAIHERLARREQVILYHNRRGHSTTLQCWDCGWVAECDACDVALTYHLSASRGGWLRCHYCGHRAPAPAECPGCGGAKFRFGGIGIQKVETLLRTTFPSARILRVDLDTVRRKGSHAEMLGRFARGEADILLGTQMIAKGLDFPRVTLAGVIQADTQLHLPDFRSGERTFQLLTQVAGRAGRHALRGEVILQTMSPDHPALVAAAAQDFESFAAYEMAERADLAYPPVTRLASLLVSAPQPGRAEEVAERLAVHVRRLAGEAAGASALFDPLALADPAATRDAVLVLGPAPRPIEKLLGRYRWHIVLKGASPRRVADLAREAIAALLLDGVPHDTRIVADIDAVDLL